MHDNNERSSNSLYVTFWMSVITILMFWAPLIVIGYLYFWQP